ncbi:MULTISPECIES: DUF5808 domain-containing protein [unclassified Flavobacterium]|uniref:DUF5808 domain-containing protein n=1 Tax=unclassified Flavobacterium TaxID=196869 RepID=UPI0012A85010|nr:MULTISPECIES: DUF5808 domain-containing protein [unclassified Flavobacterium]MBF4486041.1 hypothetical protein [Flavobacterium sp. CSZ]QGK76901.1 hypothetical protein GIY83_23355 [Flavobacterium sp. SLB02]
MKSEKPTQEDYDNWHKDPKKWYLCFFYYNPKDKRLLPPKRIEWMGYTLNLANPYSVLLLLPLVIIIALVFLLK